MMRVESLLTWIPQEPRLGERIARASMQGPCLKLPSASLVVIVMLNVSRDSHPS